MTRLSGSLVDRGCLLSRLLGRLLRLPLHLRVDTEHVAQLVDEGSWIHSLKGGNWEPIIRLYENPVYSSVIVVRVKNSGAVAQASCWTRKPCREESQCFVGV